jgi:antitoxin VapB
MSDRWSDLPGRLTDLATVASDAGVSTLVLRDPATLAWLLEARVHVPLTLDTACLDAVIDLTGTMPELTIVTNAIEAPRLQDTELADIPAGWTVVPWWESRDRRLPAGLSTGSDRPARAGTGRNRPAGQTVDVSGAVTALRRTLSPRQQTLLAGVSRDAAAAATRAASRLTPETSEYASAGLFAAELMAGGMDPIVLMVGGGDRGGRHRHPLPTSEAVGRRAMLVCCARRDGLVASVTRIVSFDPLTAEQKDAYRRLLAVEQAFLDASRPGTRLGDAFVAGAKAYEANDFDAHEWHRHHQGGLSGFQPREFPAHQSSDITLGEGMVLAWNPSAAGLKVEDTAVVASGGLELLVHDPAWPSLDVGGRARPDVLIR